MNEGLPSVLLLAALAASAKAKRVISKPAAASHVAAQTDCEATVVRTSRLSAEFKTKFSSGGSPRSSAYIAPGSRQVEPNDAHKLSRSCRSSRSPSRWGLHGATKAILR